MLTADGRASPFGDLAKCATAAGADAGAGAGAGADIQLAKLSARGWRARSHLIFSSVHRHGNRQSDHDKVAHFCCAKNLRAT